MVSPYACSCGGLDLDPSLPAMRLNYLADAHINGPEAAARHQMRLEQVLVRIGAMKPEAVESPWKLSFGGGV